MLMILFVALLVQNARGESVLFSEDFESGNTNGWILAGPDDTASQGAWFIGNPVGTFIEGEPAQPESGYQSPSCAITAQNSVGNPGSHDVDNGIVYLVSPVFDLSGYSSVRLEYVRWYYMLRLNEDPGDFFAVEVRESPGSGWVEVERLDDSISFNNWTVRSEFLESYIGLTQSVQIRFSAADGVTIGIGNVLEAAVDDVQLVAMDVCEENTDCETNEYCSMSGQCLPFGNGDVDFDGDVDITDYMDCLTCHGVSSEPCQPCNVSGDESVTVEDLAELGQTMSGPNS